MSEAEPKSRLLAGQQRVERPWWDLTLEAHVAGFGFLLNYPWEFLQTPFFAGMSEMRHWDAVRVCSWATVGDAGLLLFAFWVTAALAGSRRWIVRPAAREFAAFLAVGLLVTVVFEWLATQAWHLWSYGPRMITVPIVGTGLTAFLQWLVIPPLLIWIVRRQLAGPAAQARRRPARPAAGEDRPG